MKLVWQRFKFLGIAILALIIFIPLLVFALNTPDTGYRVYGGGVTNEPVFHYADNSLSAVYPIGTCLKNYSGNDYFVPTRTYTEWTSFMNSRPSGVTPVTCCGDKECNGSETCSTCGGVDGDCGTCACQYIYSPWSSCDNATANRTRTIISYGPTNCTGTPEPLSVACCSDCLPGNQCMDQTVYNSLTCSGNILTKNIKQCSSNSLGCGVHSPVSMVYSPSSGCTHECHTLIAGCPDGNSCRSASVYVNTASCSGAPTTLASKICVDPYTPNGSCINYSQGSTPVSIIYSSDTGCSYYTD